MLKVALRPIAAGEKVELVADRPDNVRLVVGIGVWVGVGPGQVLVKLIHHATFNKKARMEMLRIAAPTKTVLVLKLAIFVVVHDNRGKGVGHQQFRDFHSI